MGCLAQEEKLEPVGPAAVTAREMAAVASTVHQRLAWWAAMGLEVVGRAREAEARAEAGPEGAAGSAAAGAVAVACAAAEQMVPAAGVEMALGMAEAAMVEKGGERAKAVAPSEMGLTKMAVLAGQVAAPDGHSRHSRCRVHTRCTSCRLRHRRTGSPQRAYTY